MIEEQKDDKHSESGNSTKPIVSRRIVRGCSDCPMCDMLDMSPGYACNLVDSQKVGYIKQSKKTWMPITPDWCPLKVEPLLIEYGG